MEYLFVYGTLLSKANHEVIKAVKSFIKFESDGYLPGTIYDLGQYPGLIEEGTTGTAKGEVYLLDDPEKVLNELDEYEGIHDSDPEYNRAKRMVTLVTGESRDCWVYIYTKPIDPGFQMIPGGDYLSFVNNKDNNG